MPIPQPTSSTNAFFSPQTAFYAPPSQRQPIPPNQPMPGKEFLSNNPFLSVGFNVVEQGMKDITGKTVNMLPNEVNNNHINFQLIYLNNLDEKNFIIDKILFRCRSNLCDQKTLSSSISIFTKSIILSPKIQ
jgi:hypothetical protein